MDFTEGTEFFVDLERAFFETEERIFGERFAFFADVLPSRSVLAVAIFFDHHGDELLFFLPRFEFFGRFLRFCSLHDLPLFRHIRVRIH